VRRATGIALLIGLAAAVAAVLYAGLGAVARSLASLRVDGLLLLVLLHLPAVALMGLAWWLASGDDPPARGWRFVWARLIRDAGAETLPFLQVGGILLGLRALGPGRATAVRGAVAASVDGIVELTAKLPYVLLALWVLLGLAPHSRLERPLWLALVVTAGLVAPFLFARRSLGPLLARATRALSRRFSAMLALEEASIGGEIRDSFERILRQRARLASGFAIHLGCWFLGAAETWVAFRLLGVNLSAPQALAIDGAVMGLRTFGFMVPAAAGVQEGSYLLVAAVFGIPPAVGIAASLARRARDLALGFATFAIAALVDDNFSLRRLAPLIKRAGTRSLPEPVPAVSRNTSGARTPDRWTDPRP